jgi:YD repeat-containing protein
MQRELILNSKAASLAFQYAAMNRRIFAGFGTQAGPTYESTISYSYDAGDRLIQAVDSISGTITRSCDGLDRLISEVTPQGSVSYAYDSAGRRTSMTVSGQTAVTYGHDNANRPTRYARTIPYQILVVIAVLNMAVIISFVFCIIKVYLRRRALTPPSNMAPRELGSKSSAEADRRRLIAFWIGAGLCCAAFIKSFLFGRAYVGKAPLPVLIFAEIFNGAILATFLWAIRKTYKKLRSGAS